MFHKDRLIISVQAKSVLIDPVSRYDDEMMKGEAARKTVLSIIMIMHKRSEKRKARRNEDESAKLSFRSVMKTCGRYKPRSNDKLNPQSMWKSQIDLKQTSIAANTHHNTTKVFMCLEVD
jgi:hypothetical protein